MRIRWTFSRRLALGFAVIVVALATQPLQISSQSTPLTSPTRLVQTT